MSFLELVKARHSCRKYSSKPVERESILRCLEAARLAPSACNSQPWRFIVVDNPQLKKELVDCTFSGVYAATGAFAKQAPVIVVLIRESSKYIARLGGALRGIQYSLIDLGIVGEHFALQVQEEGLGTCWIGWFNEAGVKKVLGLAKNTKVDALFTVGYPQDANTYSPKNRKSISEISEFR